MFALLRITGPHGAKVLVMADKADGPGRILSVSTMVFIALTFSQRWDQLCFLPGSALAADAGV